MVRTGSVSATGSDPGNVSSKPSSSFFSSFLRFSLRALLGARFGAFLVFFAFFALRLDFFAMSVRLSSAGAPHPQVKRALAAVRDVRILEADDQ